MLKVAYINPDCQAALQKAGLLTEDAILRWTRGRLVADKKWSTVFRADIEGIGAVYVKRYFPQKNRLLGAFRNTQAFREYRCSATLMRLGVPQPEPILSATVRNQIGMTRCGIYMMREVQNAQPLDTILEQMRENPDPVLLKDIADNLIELLNRMHNGNFCHWDFKPRNLLVTRQSGRLVITPIDSRSGRRMSLLTRRFFIRRDYAFLLREPLLSPFFRQHNRT